VISGSPGQLKIPGFFISWRLNSFPVVSFRLPSIPFGGYLRKPGTIHKVLHFYISCRLNSFPVVSFRLPSIAVGGYLRKPGTIHKVLHFFISWRLNSFPIVSFRLPSIALGGVPQAGPDDRKRFEFFFISTRLRNTSAAEVPKGEFFETAKQTVF